MVNDSDKIKVFSELREKYIKMFEKEILKPKFVKNSRDIDGLEESIFSGYEDFETYEDFDYDNLSVETYKNKVDWYMRRSTYLYVHEAIMYSVIRRFNNIGLSEDDKVSAGRVGFMLALNTFDESKGYKFSTYAWRVIQNEIIAADKKRKKAVTVKQKAREIRALDDLDVISITESIGARKIVEKGERMFLQNITTLDIYGSRKDYEFIYHIPDYVFPGARITKGTIMGKIAGVETEIASLDVFVDDEENRIPTFKNPMSNKDEGVEHPDYKLNSKETLDVLAESLKTLTKMEQIVITKRFLSAKKQNRSSLSKELGLSDYNTSKIETSALEKLKKFLEENGVDRLDIFSI